MNKSEQTVLMYLLKMNKSDTPIFSTFQIIRALDLSPTIVYRNINKFEEEGIVKRIAFMTRKIVELTKKGVELALAQEKVDEKYGK